MSKKCTWVIPGQITHLWTKKCLILWYIPCLIYVQSAKLILMLSIWQINLVLTNYNFSNIKTAILDFSLSLLSLLSLNYLCCNTDDIRKVTICSVWIDLERPMWKSYFSRIQLTNFLTYIPMHLRKRFYIRIKDQDYDFSESFFAH